MSGTDVDKSQASGYLFDILCAKNKRDALTAPGKSSNKLCGMFGGNLGVICNDAYNTSSCSDTKEFVKLSLDSANLKNASDAKKTFFAIEIYIGCFNGKRIIISHIDRINAPRPVSTCLIGGKDLTSMGRMHACKCSENGGDDCEKPKMKEGVAKKAFIEKACKTITSDGPDKANEVQMKCNNENKDGSLADDEACCAAQFGPDFKNYLDLTKTSSVSGRRNLAAVNISTSDVGADSKSVSIAGNTVDTRVPADKMNIALMANTDIVAEEKQNIENVAAGKTTSTSTTVYSIYKVSYLLIVLIALFM